jgi:hypothetical protein
MAVKQTKSNLPGPGPGRPKGSVNKATALIKDAVLDALAAAHPEGAAGYLKLQAEKNPVAFMGLIGKVLPLQVDAHVAGKLIVAWKDE